MEIMHGEAWAMPLRNRVTPFGTIEAVAARGMLMGNRGVLHDAARTVLRDFTTYRGWVCCVLKFYGRRRSP
jgi:hypothetical protein